MLNGTSDGEEYAEVKTSGLVTGLKYANGWKFWSYLSCSGLCEGLDAYIKGEDKILTMLVSRPLTTIPCNTLWLALSHIGTLKWPKMILFPVNEEFLKAEGSNFGSVKPSSILYNGPYLLKSLTSKSVMEFVKTQITMTKTMWLWIASSWPIMMEMIRKHWFVTSAMAFTAQLVSIRIAQVLPQSRRKPWTISYIARRILLLIT